MSNVSREAPKNVLSAARRRRGGFFLLLDLGPGAAACGMGIEINTGYRCYLSAARRRFRSTQPFAIACRLEKIVNFFRPETVRS